MRTILLSLGLACITSTAHATTIDFEEFAGVPTSGLGAITSQGFTLTSVGTGMYTPDYYLSVASGDFTYGWCPDCTLILEDSTGDLFSIFSAYLARTSAGSIAITGYQAGGGILQTTYFSDATTPPVLFEFGNEWVNLERIEFGSGGIFGQITDDIVVSTVPVPPALLLFGSAIAGLVGFRRARLTQRTGCL